MAHITGTATDHNDYYAKLIEFLTEDTTLSGLDQNWDIAWTHPDGAETGVVLRGPGLSDQDSIYVAMRLYEDAPTEGYWIELSGCTGVLPDSTSYRDHVNNSPHTARMFLDDGEMTYWFTASGRRFIAVAQISTVYEAMYAGFFLPYSTPLSYPYPYFFGGSAGTHNPNNANSPDNWRAETNFHRHFADTYESFSGASVNDIYAAGMALTPAGTWERVSSGNASAGSGLANLFFFPSKGEGDLFGAQDEAASYSVTIVRQRLYDAYGGDQMLWPLTLMRRSPQAETYGVLDGFYKAQGLGNSTENVVTIDGVDHLIIQNVFRTDLDNFLAFVME